MQDINRDLISAVREGRLESARELISSFGLSYSPSWSDGYVLLCEALENKHAAMAKLLLTSGSKVNTSKKSTDTPLHFAVKNGDIEIVKMILEKGANIEAENRNGGTPLYDAVENGKIEVTEFLLKHKARVNNRDNDGTSPLHVAVELGCLQIIEQLLKYGADINCVCTSTSKWEIGYTPLHCAVENGSKEVVTLLLSRGANVDVKAEDGLTPLHIAASKGHICIAEDLLKHGACIHSLTLEKGYMPLHLALELDNEDLVEKAVKLFLNSGADINASSKNSLTPLYFATKRGHYIVVILLLLNGAKVDYQDKDGKTALHLAVSNGNLMIIEALLQHGADVNARVNAGDKYGRIALHFAINGITEPPPTSYFELLTNEYITGEIDKLLLTKGVNLYTQTTDGTTALHLSAKNDNVEIIKILLRFGADINSRDEYGRTALHIASEGGYIGVIASLLRYGADINIASKNNRTAFDHASAGMSAFYNLGSSEFNNYDELFLFDHAKCQHDDIVQHLRDHIVKLKTANLYVSKENLQSVYDEIDDGLEIHYEEISDDGMIDMKIYLKKVCEEEIANMKSEIINNTRISFYDILAKDTISLNENMVQILKSVDYKTKFPMYASMIVMNIKRAMERKKLLEQSINIFHLLINNLPELPYDCTEKIFSYLSNKDLKIFVDALGYYDLI